MYLIVNSTYFFKKENIDPGYLYFRYLIVNSTYIFKKENIDPGYL